VQTVVNVSEGVLFLLAVVQGWVVLSLAGGLTASLMGLCKSGNAATHAMSLSIAG